MAVVLKCVCGSKSCGEKICQKNSYWLVVQVFVCMDYL